MGNGIICFYTELQGKFIPANERILVLVGLLHPGTGRKF